MKTVVDREIEAVSGPVARTRLASARTSSCRPRPVVSFPYSLQRQN